MTRPRASFVLLLAAVSASGCAFGNRTARLAWPPPGAALAPAPPPTAPAVSLQRLLDERPEPRKVVGEVKNGFGMHTADVETPDDVAAWATAALRDELQRAGVRVVEPAPGVPEVGGELRRAFATAYMSYSGEVELRAWLRRGEAVDYNANVRGEGKAGTNWAATGEGYAETLANAVRDGARKVASAVAAVLGIPQPPLPGPAAAPPGS